MNQISRKKPLSLSPLVPCLCFIPLGMVHLFHSFTIPCCWVLELLSSYSVWMCSRILRSVCILLLTKLICSICDVSWLIHLGGAECYSCVSFKSLPVGQCTVFSRNYLLFISWSPSPIPDTNSQPLYIISYLPDDHYCINSLFTKAIFNM